MNTFTVNTVNKNNRQKKITTSQAVFVTALLGVTACFRLISTEPAAGTTLPAGQYKQLDCTQSESRAFHRFDTAGNVYTACAGVSMSEINQLNQH